jgi:ABC-type lipoprotein release transport system permease subunit
MNRSTNETPRPTRLRLVTSIVTLARWRWRQHWFLLLVIGVAMVAAITIVCTVPLLSEIAQTAGLRGVLTASSGSSEITMRVNAPGLAGGGVEDINQAVSPPFDSYLEPYLSGPPRLDVQTPDFGTLSPMTIYGTSMQDAAAHVTLVQGRLPRTASQDVEVAITPATAGPLHLGVGSTITLDIAFYRQPAELARSSPMSLHLQLHVVGIFNVKPGDGYWHGEDFLPEATLSGSRYTVLVSAQTLLAVLDSVAQSYSASQVFFPAPSYIYWYYYLDPSHISIEQLDDLIAQLARTQQYLAENFSSAPFQMILAPPHVREVDVYGSVLSSSALPSSLERFRDRVAVLRIPVAILGVQVIALLLFFVSVMAGLLVDRQAEVIALLRSRGASSRQVLGALVTQSIGLGLIALVAGPPLAIAAVSFIVGRLFLPADQGALNIIANAPLQAILDGKWYAIVTVIVTVLAMIAALYRASRLNVWATGREAKHSSRRPLWQHLNLDIVAAIIALAGYAISLYLANIGELLDAQTQALVSSPLALIAPIFLLLAAILLLLRFFPLLLHLGSSLALRGRGAVPMLALTQMARAPRQSLRMILLLALASAFAIFTLIFAGSQAQRAVDIAAYQAGADFSGAIPLIAKKYPLNEETALYRKIPGVLSATAGYEEQDTAAATSVSVQLKAVDPGTFAQTAIWTAQDSSQPLASLMAQLVAGREEANNSGVIPAIVDASAWNMLALHTGTTFSMHSDNAPTENIRYVVVAEVRHIPTINTSSEGGVMVDYQSFAHAWMKIYGINGPINYAWLRTSDDPGALASVRAALTTPNLQLENLLDRRMLADSLRSDPLSLNITSILVFGATTALLLALVGNMLVSWLSVRTRLANFIVLRALGTAPEQIARVLLWEQGIVYAAALFLGALFGALLAVTVVPTLVFTSVPASGLTEVVSSSEFYDLQHLLPVQVVVPPSLALACIVFVVICVVALGMMVRVALQPSMSQLLRLDEDRALASSTREETVSTRVRPVQTVSPRPGQSFRPSIATLALWGLRRSWFLVLLAGVGIIAAVAIVCALPLFSTVTTSAGLHSVLTASPAGSELTVDAFPGGLSTRVVHATQQQFDPLFQQYLGTYLSQQTAYSLQVAGFAIVAPKQPPHNAYAVQLVGTSLELTAPHLTLLQGRLPQTASGAIETLLTPSTARSLHVAVGSMMTLHFETYLKSTGRVSPAGILKLRIAGLFNVRPGDPFWHGQDFQPVKEDQLHAYTLLIAGDAFLAALDRIATASNADAVFSFDTYELRWYYHLDTARITTDQLDDLISRLYGLQTTFANKFGYLQSAGDQSSAALNFPYLLHINLFNPVQNSYAIPGILDQYRNRVAVVSIPFAILILQITGLIIFFVSLLASLLVDRQADSIAILRSRGASSRQVFGSLLVQVTASGILALVVGPLLALVAVSYISHRMLVPAEQDAINLITVHPMQTLLGVGWYALATVLVAIIAMSLVLRRAASINVLALRRETARTTRRPFWQRLNLDLVAAIIALAGYGISVYLVSVGKLLDTRTKVLVSAPLTLAASICLLIGSLLLFLRCFPSLLRLGAWFAGRRRGAVSVLALAQVARAPRQSVRMTLLLALATAFAIFTLVFTASQSQRILDIAAYESGADFSGAIPTTAQQLSMKGETAKYRNIAGVLSATVGYTGAGTPSGAAPSMSIEIRAVDASTFAHTAIWTAQDSSQSLTSLMAQLVAQRRVAPGEDVVPVIVDAATMNKLALQTGSIFTVNVSSLVYGNLNCLVIAEVQHIPTVNSSPDAGSVGEYTPPGGILADYATYAALYTRDIVAKGVNGVHTLPINHVWLRTQDAPAALAHVRAALQTPALRLDQLYDRRALIDSLSTDPLYLGLVVMLTIGAVTALLLALIGDLLVSWLSVRARLTSFAVLRALGAAPRHIASVLTWEQGVVYATALVLGVVFGALLSLTVVPALVFTDVPSSGVLSDVSSGEFYALQHVIPSQVVVPLSLSMAFIVLIAVCLLALGMMVRVVLQPSLSKTLRLEED